MVATRTSAHSWPYAIPLARSLATGRRGTPRNLPPLASLEPPQEGVRSPLRASASSEVHPCVTSARGGCVREVSAGRFVRLYARTRRCEVTVRCAGAYSES